MTKKIIISIIALANIMFVPVFDVWGGLFPGVVDYGFFDVFNLVSIGETNMWVVVFTFSIFFPCIFLLIPSFFKKDILFKIASIFGIVSMMITFVRFVSEYDMEYLFDFDDGNISIGTWIAFILFILAFVMPLKKKQGGSVPDAKFSNKLDYNERANAVLTVEGIPNNEKQYCPNCGAKLQKKVEFCGNCGSKL